jgi:hypothetical protein
MDPRGGGNHYGQAAIAVFLEDGQNRVVKQAMAACIEYGGQDPGPNGRKVLVTAAHNIKVPLPRHGGGRMRTLFERKNYRVRAIVIFAIDDNGMLSGATAVTADANPRDGEQFLKEGVHFDTCLKSKAKQDESDFALIYLENVTTLVAHTSGSDVLQNLDFINLGVQRDDASRIIAGVTYYTVRGFEPAHVDHTMTWARHRQQLADHAHLLFTRAPISVTLRARHSWEPNPNDVNINNPTWKWPKNARPHERRKVKVFDLGVVSLDRMSFVLHEVPVDTDILLGQGLQQGIPNRALPRDISGFLSNGSLCGAPWLCRDASNHELVLGILLGGNRDPRQLWGVGGLYAGLMFNDRFKAKVGRLFGRQRRHAPDGH